MEKRGVFTKILAIAGTILVWIPILAPVLFSGIVLLRSGRFRFDYLMPAELFPFALVGGGLLIWAALRARARWGLIGWGLGIAVVMLVGGQALAVVTGLASGETEPRRLAVGARPRHAGRFFPGVSCRGRWRNIIAARSVPRTSPASR